MGLMKDLMINIHETVKETLVPLFYTELNADCVEAYIDEDKLMIEIMVELEIGDKFYRMDISQLPKDCIMWTDEQFKEYFKEAFKVMSKFPIPFEEALNTRINLNEYKAGDIV